MSIEDNSVFLIFICIYTLRNPYDVFSPKYFMCGQFYTQNQEEATSCVQMPMEAHILKTFSMLWNQYCLKYLTG